MKKAAAIFLLLAVASFFATGISSQTEEIGVSASEVPKLISVTASLSFENLVPTHLYASPIKIGWAVPDSALSNLAESEVIVRVRIEPRTSNSWIYFEKEGVRYKTAYTELHCLVEAGKCTGKSALTQTIIAYYVAPLGAQYPHDDGLKVSAFLMPIEQLQQEALLEQSASAQISSLSQIAAQATTISTANEISQQVNELVEQARALLAEKRFDEMKAQIALLQEKVEQLQKAKQNAQAAGAKASEIGKSALELTGSLNANENKVPQAEPNQTNSTAIAATGENNASGTTGFFVNSSTAAAAGAVGLFMAALLGYAATRRKGARLTQVSSRMSEIDGDSPSMGSGQASIAASKEHSPLAREKNGSGDIWSG